MFIVGSFWLFGTKTSEIVFEQNKFTGEALANAALLAVHFEKQEQIPELQLVDAETAKDLLKLKYYWGMLLPENPQRMLKPQDDFEWFWTSCNLQNTIWTHTNRIGEDMRVPDIQISESQYIRELIDYLIWAMGREPRPTPWPSSYKPRIDTCLTPGSQISTPNQCECLVSSCRVIPI